MAVRQFIATDKPPDLNWWKSILRKWFGSQDIVAVVVVLPGSSRVQWFYGADITRPVASIDSESDCASVVKASVEE